MARKPNYKFDRKQRQIAEAEKEPAKAERVGAAGPDKKEYLVAIEA